MKGQRHYVIAKELEDGRTQFWRGRRGLERGHEGWTYDLTAARSYRRAHDALRAARQLDTSASLEVQEVEIVVSKVCYRVTVEDCGVAR